MSNIANYKSNNTAAPISYAKRESYTEKVQKFIKYLHEFMPVITQEFDDLEQRSKTKPCKAFDDKMSGLAAIFQAEKDLYYWYVENAKRQAE